MTVHKVHAVLDQNEVENNPLLVAEINANNYVLSWEVQPLDAGDFRLDNIGFERKTPSDWASSITDDRLDEQRHKLIEMYDKAYILYEGNLGDTERREAVGSGIDPAAQRGAMARTTELGIPVIPCDNLRLLVDMAVRLARKEKEPTTPYLPRGTVKKPTAPVAMQMYGCLPNVGLETARELYARYPTIDSFVTEATIDSLQEIDGIGEKTAAGIVEALGK